MRFWGEAGADAARVRRTPRHARRPGGDARIGALDGLRAVAVAAVVAYHLWPWAVPAGYLGVDLFMVLSGFLITGLLLDERTRSGALDLGAFWVRRFRRLVPALLALLAVVAVWVDVAGPTALAATARRQGIAALLYVGNWRLIADHTSYAALAKPPSPMLHLWSLAIEEQFYVVWPLVVIAVIALGRGRRAPVGIAAVAGAAASIVWMAHLYEPGRDPLRLYFGTDTRAHTLLIGAAAAVLVRSRWGATVTRLAPRFGVVAFAIVVGAFVAGDRPDLLYRGGFAVIAVIAAVATVAVTRPGPLTRALDRGPLRGLGRVSYGVYLWHWPIIVLVTADRTGLHGPLLDGVRLGLIAAATALSWVLVEQPFRRATPRVAVRIAPAGITAAALALLVLPASSGLAYASVDTSRLAPVEVADAAAAPATTPATVATVAPATSAPSAAPATVGRIVLASPPPTTAPLDVHTVMLIGDSGTFDLAPALMAGFTANGIRVVNVTYPGEGLTQPPGEEQHWSDTIDQYAPDLVIVGLGVWDQDYIDQHGALAYSQVVDQSITMLTHGGAHVLWLSILPQGEATGQPRPVVQQSIYSSLPTRHAGVVDYLDISPALTAPDGSVPRSIDDQLLRKPDGWHLCPAGAAAVAHEILGHLGLDGVSWDAGRWRRDARYDDPPGGCA